MPLEADLLESYAQDLASLAESITEKDLAGKQSMLQLLTGDVSVFCAAGIRVLARSKPSPGSRLLVHLLTKEKLLTASLLDPDICSEDEAAAASRAVEAIGTHLQVGLEMALSSALQIRGKAENSARVLRILRLMEAIEAQSCWASFQTDLLTHHDEVVRSRSTLLIGRTSRNMGWISRRLLDRDPRVQANAVEALWDIDPAEALPPLRTALHSPHKRVAANAAVGLYRMSELKAIPAMIEMAKHPDPDFRVSALWAIGQTEDPRFVPFLMERFKVEQAKLKFAVTRALSQIRRREKANAEAGTLALHIPEASINDAGRRHIAVTVSHVGEGCLPPLKPVQFAVWEGGELIDAYSVECPSVPVLLVVGFIIPRSSGNAYDEAIMDCLKRCLAEKRRDDLWRIDRYITETSETTVATLTEASPLPYDNELATQEIKQHFGFIADAGQLEKAITHVVPRDRAASDVIKAVERQYEALTRISGKRHLFLFIPQDNISELEDPESISRLTRLAEQENIALHGICLGPALERSGFRDLCLSQPDGSFDAANSERLAPEVQRRFSHLLSHFEVDYTKPGAAGSVVLQVSTHFGIGRIEFNLNSD